MDESLIPKVDIAHREGVKEEKNGKMEILRTNRAN